MSDSPSVVIVGGGLAGMAAALALAEHQVPVLIIESKRNLGGRASSFRDFNTGETIDFCQHVSMGCCANLADFCRRANLSGEFRRIKTLHFIGPKGEQCKLRASEWLPAPFHLLPALWGLTYLSRKDRHGIARGLFRLGRIAPDDRSLDETHVHQWLGEQRQSSRAIDGFWRVILVSALGEALESISLGAARKVFVDGFMANKQAYEMLVPEIPLGELYGDRLEKELRSRKIHIFKSNPVRNISRNSAQNFEIKFTSCLGLEASHVILATTWRQTAGLLSEQLLEALPEVAAAKNFSSSPITGVHLWFDKAITHYAHAVLVNRLSQWIFHAGIEPNENNNGGSKSNNPVKNPPQVLFYYQVVISASYDLIPMTKDQIIAKVLSELDDLFPVAKDARLIRAHVVTERNAVFSPNVGTAASRPSQVTAVPKLFLAGDWTATGWPATMEGAVRSGYLAAEGVLKSLNRPQRILVDEPKRGLVASWLLK